MLSLPISDWGQPPGCPHGISRPVLVWGLSPTTEGGGEVKPAEEDAKEKPTDGDSIPVASDDADDQQIIEIFLGALKHGSHDDTLLGEVATLQPTSHCQVDADHEPLVDDGGEDKGFIPRRLGSVDALHPDKDMKPAGDQKHAAVVAFPYSDPRSSLEDSGGCYPPMPTLPLVEADLMMVDDGAHTTNPVDDQDSTVVAFPDDCAFFQGSACTSENICAIHAVGKHDKEDADYAPVAARIFGKADFMVSITEMSFPFKAHNDQGEDVNDNEDDLPGGFSVLIVADHDEDEAACADQIAEEKVACGKDATDSCDAASYQGEGQAISPAIAGTVEGIPPISGDEIMEAANHAHVVDDPDYRELPVDGRGIADRVPDTTEVNEAFYIHADARFGQVLNAAALKSDHNQSTFDIHVPEDAEVLVTLTSLVARLVTPEEQLQITSLLAEMALHVYIVVSAFLNMPVVTSPMNSPTCIYSFFSCQGRKGGSFADAAAAKVRPRHSRVLKSCAFYLKPRFKMKSLQQLTTFHHFLLDPG